MASPTTSKRHSHHRDPAADGNSFRFSPVRGQDQTNGRYGWFCIQNIFLSITEGLPCFLSSPATALFGSMLPASDTPRFSPSFPQSLNLPSNSPSHASWSQPPTLLSISFSAAKHVAHITTPRFSGSTYLGWEKMYNLCCHISTLQRNPEVPIQPWLSKEFSAPRAKLPAAEISVFGNRSWNRGSD